MYREDNKIFANNEIELESVLQTIRIFIEDIVV